MNIAHIILSLKCGGMEKVAIDLASAQLRTGERASICCLDEIGELGREAAAKGIPVSCFNRRPGFDVRLILRLARHFRSERPDIVHSHNPGSMIYGAIAARLAGVPVVIMTRHGREKKVFSRFLWGLHNAVVAISEDAKNQMLSWNRIPAEKTKTIYNGIALPATSELTDSLPVEEGDLVIGTSGRLAREKNYALLIDAFKLVLAKLPKARLLLAGDGPLRAELEARAREAGVDGRTHFLGFRSDIPAILGRIDVFALPSLTEGVSISILEAMAMGKPVVTTHVGGNPEVVINGETGLLVPSENPGALADALYRVLSDREQAKAMGQAGAGRVHEFFGIDRMNAEYLRLYRGYLPR